MPRRIRVAEVIPGLHYGGMERILHDLVRELSARGLEVHIVITDQVGRFGEGLERFAVLHPAPRMSRLSLLYPARLARLLRDIAPDVVHSHGGVWLKAAVASRLARVPVVIHSEHGRPVPDRWIDRAIDNLASRFTDTIIAVGEDLANLLARKVVHDPRRVRVIANGVDVERLKPGPTTGALRRELGIPQDAPVLGSVGRLEPVKNYRLALRAFARLGAETEAPLPYLVLAGDGSKRGELESLAGALGVSPRVRFLGWRDDIDEVLGAFDVFIMTSNSEGTSVSLLEAMSRGLCPVVTDVGGNRGVLGPDLASLLVPAGDEIGVSAGWARALADPGFRGAMGCLARKRVEQEFSFRKTAEKHLALYHELVEQARSRSGEGGEASG